MRNRVFSDYRVSWSMVDEAVKGVHQAESRRVSYHSYWQSLTADCGCEIIWYNERVQECFSDIIIARTTLTM